MSTRTLIKAARMRLHLNEEEFGKLFDVSRGTIQQWEKEGGTAPNRKRQPLVAKVLGISVATLMAEDSNESPTNEPVGKTTAPTLADTLSRLGELLERASPKTRAVVADLLGRYAQDPINGHSIAQAIELLVNAETGKTRNT